MKCLVNICSISCLNEEMLVDFLNGKDSILAENRFAYATDLVRHIRETFGDYFVIGVAGSVSFC